MSVLDLSKIKEINPDKTETLILVLEPLPVMEPIEINTCSIELWLYPEFPVEPGSIEITKNGSYDVLNYTEAIVNIPIEDYSTKYTENGTYIIPKSEGAYLDNVIITVDVLPKLAFRSATLTANNTSVRIKPGVGYYGLSSTYTRVRIPEQSKSISVSENGKYDIIPDDGKVLTKAEVEVYIPPTPLQVKSVTVTKNDATVEVLPDDGYALERVDVTTAIVPIVKGIRLLSTGYVGSLPYIFDFTGMADVNQFASNCSKLTCISGIINTGSVKNMGYMFRGCSSLTTLDVSKWDTGSVTNMSGMFWGCSSLTTLDVSKWDTGSVTNMYEMFRGCSSLTTLDVSKLDTGSVTNMSGMFWGCSSLKEIKGIGELNTSSCSNMDYCFAFTALTRLDLHTWDMSNVTRMSYFLRTSAIERVDMHGWNVESLTTMASAFQECSNLKWLDMTGWTDCSNFLPSYEFHFNNHNILTLIGDRTLAEVEAGEVSLYKNLGKKDGTLKWASWQFMWTYASMLAMCQGLYDRTGLTANTISLPKSTFNNCYNDDGSIPDADTIASRQAAVRAIIAEKNYTLSIY